MQVTDSTFTLRNYINYLHLYTLIRYATDARK